jgi:hypothetical protein
MSWRPIRCGNRRICSGIEGQAQAQGQQGAHPGAHKGGMGCDRQQHCAGGNHAGESWRVQQMSSRRRNRAEAADNIIDLPVEYLPVGMCANERTVVQQLIAYTRFTDVI